MMEIYAHARAFMAEHGNPRQWGPTNWPPQDLIHQDIRKGNSYVCLNEDDKVIGTFFFVYGEDFHIDVSQTRDHFESLWAEYFEHIAIAERKNPRCQNNLIPKWYRKNMVEFS